MSREIRTILVLLLLALGGVSALAFMAYRYGRIVDGGPAGSSAEIARQVEEFIVVREAMRREIDSWGPGGSRPEALILVRDRALMLHAIRLDAYRATRERYRDWRAGRLAAGSAMANALDAHREALERANLGDYERLDS